MSNHAWDSVAEAYAERVEPFTSQFAAPLLDAACEALGGVAMTGAHVLDVAAGSGAVALEALRRGAKVTATDGSGEMLRVASERARAANHELATRVAEGTALPLDLAGGSLLATSGFGVIFFPDVAAGLSDCAAVAPDREQRLLTRTTACTGSPS